MGALTAAARQGRDRGKLYRMNLTRRKLAAAMLSPAAAVALAQTQTTPSVPEDEVKAARDRLRSAADALSRQEVPVSTEPAFQFKA